MLIEDWAKPIETGVYESWELFVPVWKLYFGYEWVDWHDAMNFKQRIGMNHVQLVDLSLAGVFVKTDGYDEKHQIKLKEGY